MAAAVNIVICRKVSKEVKSKLLSNDIRLTDVDFLAIEYLHSPQLASRAGRVNAPWVFTSQHGVQGICILRDEYHIEWRDHRCYALDGTTKDRAEEAGFTCIDSGKNGQELAEAIVSDGEQAVIHATAALRREELYKILQQNQVAIEPLVVYRKVKLEKKVGAFDGVAFLSPSQYDAFCVHNALQSDQPAFCIGSTTGNYIKQYGHDKIIVSDTASLDGLVQTIINYYKDL